MRVLNIHSKKRIKKLKIITLENDIKKFLEVQEIFVRYFYYNNGMNHEL